MEAQSIEVNGRIIFKETVPAISHATIHIYAEDISYADAPAPLLAETTVSDISHNPSAMEMNGETIIPFTIRIGPEFKIDPKNNYTIRVMVELNNGDKTGKKELNTDESFCILTNGCGRYVDISFK